MSGYSDFRTLMGKNAIINGDMTMWQRGSTYSGTESRFVADRWFTFSTGLDRTVSRQDDGPGSGLVSCLSYSPDEIDNPISVDGLGCRQAVEGLNACRLYNGWVTLSFWVKSNVTGTYCVSFRDEPRSRSYLVEYTIDQADTWEYKTVSFFLDTSTGTWNTDTSSGLDVLFCLGVSGTYSGSLGWNSGNYLGTSNQVNLATSTSNYWRITGVQLEQGSVATGFEFLDHSIITAQCQRYFETDTFNFGFRSDAGTAGSFLSRTRLGFNTSKRSTPSININSGSYSNCQFGGVTVIDEGGFSVDMNSDGGGTNHIMSGVFEADAEL